MKVREYIKNSWNLTKDDSGFIPYPFVPPCANGGFNVLYYWDTFFTNEGLIADGRVEDARNNVNNLVHFLDKFGCVPNCTSEGGADYCSQPPFLYWMIARINEVDYDEAWAAWAYAALEREYAFWMRERITPCGLNRYGTNATEEKLLCDYYSYVRRFRLPLDEHAPVATQIKIAQGLIAEAESGEDYTPRFLHEADEYAPVDLNTHLYRMELALAKFYQDKDGGKSERYARAAKERAEKMRALMQDEEGVFHDYRFTNNQRSRVYAAACFLPYIAGLADGGIQTLIQKLDVGCGIAACEDLGKAGFQWGYPRVWAPHQYFAVKALLACGKTTEAQRIAASFTQSVREKFEKTERLWEKYAPAWADENAEYPAHEMLGWTAGTYAVFYDLLKEN